MPDWSYQTIFKPLLFQLPTAKSRDITLGAMRVLSSLPLGPKIITFMGHMKPEDALRKELFGLAFSSPVGLSGKLDPKLIGLKPLAQFGFGFIEIGPVTVEKYGSVDEVSRNIQQEELAYASHFSNCGLDYVKMQLSKLGKVSTPIGIRIAHTPGVKVDRVEYEFNNLCEELDKYADFFILQLDLVALRDKSLLQRVLTASRKPVLLAATPEQAVNQLKDIEDAIDAGIRGLVIDEGHNAEGETSLYGRLNKKAATETIIFLRSKGINVPIIASGGVHEPEDARDLLNAGADMIQIHSGLVFSGPGLPKRINEAIVPKSKAEERNQKGWLGFGLFGIGIFIAGLFALFFGLTSVVLPYDERFLGLTREQIIAIDHKLLHFMSHDRITLAGTMISASILYWQLAYFGVRNRIHWAKVAITAAGTAGFLSFFLFIGYGYFDWLHFIFYILLIPPFLYGIYYSKDVNRGFPSTNLRNDAVWKRSLWGQLMFVSLGIALVVAGITISIIGINDVFVKEDLAYLGISPEKLNGINERLIPLIAHDRAGFGGALFADGLLLLMLALWGYREGHRWVWYALFFGGMPGFLAALGTHFHIGYVDWWHLFPAFIALFLYVGGLIFSFSFLFKKTVK